MFLHSDGVKTTGEAELSTTGCSYSLLQPPLSATSSFLQASTYIRRQNMKSLSLLALFIRFNFVTTENRTCLLTSEIVASIIPYPLEYRALNYLHPVNVSLKLAVQEITRIRELSSEFELDVYVTETWFDPTLTFSHYLPCRKNTVYREKYGIFN